MLWKYKKCYSETNDDIIEPTNCYKLVTALYTDLDLNSTDSETITYTLCDTTREMSRTLENNTIVDINDCIKFTPNFGLDLDSDITETDIQDSIANNTQITKNVLTLGVTTGSLKVTFEKCGEFQLYNISTESGQQPDNGCTWALTTGVFIFGGHINQLADTTDIVCNTQNLSDRFNGQDRWWRVGNNATASSQIVLIDGDGVIQAIDSICP